MTGGGNSYAKANNTKAPQKMQLYNLAEDLSETKNLSQEQPEKLAELKAFLAKARGTIDAQ
jgi:arylsulfatase A-like enzyme